MAKKLQLFVPTIGAKLKLTSPWTFQVHLEGRNDSMLKVVRGKGYDWSEWDNDGKSVGEATLPKGTVLTVDRIYIRKGKGMDHFNSITFRFGKNDCPDKKFGTQRFWVKLSDANQIKCEVDDLWLEN